MFSRDAARGARRWAEPPPGQNVVGVSSEEGIADDQPTSDRGDRLRCTRPRTRRGGIPPQRSPGSPGGAQRRGVWVVNTQLRLLGHLNAQSRTLDGGLRAASDSFDVLQSAASVLIDDALGSSLQRVDPSTVAIVAQLDQEGLEVSHGGGSVAVADPGDGAVWAVEAAALNGFDVSQEPLLAESPRRSGRDSRHRDGLRRRDQW